MAVAVLLPGTSTAQRLHVESPNGGETLKAGETTTIRWSGVRSGKDSVRLEYSVDGGATWRMIVETAGDSSYQWVAPYTSGTSCLMRIEQITGAFTMADTFRTFAAGDVALSLRFNEDGSRVMLCGGPRARIWDVETGEMLALFSTDFNIFGCDFRPGGSQVVLGGNAGVYYDDPVAVYDIATQEKVFQDDQHYQIIEMVRYSPDGKKFVTASRDGTAKVWDAETGTMLDSLFHPFGVTFVAVSADDSLVAGGGYYSNYVKVWNIDGRDTVAILRHPGSEVYAGVFHPNGKWLLTLSDSVRVWDIATSALIKSLPSVGGFGSGLAVTPDGRSVVVWSKNSNILQFWDLQKWTLARTITHELGLHGAAVSPDGRWLMTKQLQGRPCVIWHLYNNDTSDAVWSILSGGIEAADVDLGRSKVGEPKDSAVTAFVRNSGGEALSVTELRLTGSGAGEFGVTSGGAPFEIPAGGAHEVGFRFTPEMVGTRIATVEMVTATSDTIRVAIRGEGYKEVTGVAEGEREERGGEIDLTVYPNPVRATAVVSWNGGGIVDGPVRVMLRDVLGREVMEITPSSGAAGSRGGNIEADLGTLPVGQYYVEVRSGTRRAVAPLIVIR